MDILFHWQNSKPVFLDTQQLVSYTVNNSALKPKLYVVEINKASPLGQLGAGCDLGDSEVDFSIVCLKCSKCLCQCLSKTDISYSSFFFPLCLLWCSGQLYTVPSFGGSLAPSGCATWQASGQTCVFGVQYK